MLFSAVCAALPLLIALIVYGPSIRWFIVLLLCLAVGLICASILGRVALREPAQRLLAASNRLAEGDYSIRLSSAVSGGPLYGELGELAASLDRAMAAMERRERALEEEKRRADSANVAKSEFLANMSHEIRTPMNAILGMAYLMLKTELSQQQSGYAQKIHAAGTQLLGIINDVLDFSKIESGKLDIENVPFRLEDVLSNVATLLSQKADEKNLEFLFDLDPAIPDRLLGDPMRVGQILINLAGNAIKFTESGEVIISCRLAELTDSDAEVAFSVRDTGIGMSDEQVGRLFTPFTQADASITRRFGGTGLGLVITKRLLELMGGDIRVESASGRGTSFHLNARFNVPKPVKIPSYSAQLKGSRILVVDDNESAREIFASTLESMSFAVQTADSAKAAFKILRDAEDQGDPFRLALLDWRMPEIDGIQATRRILNDLGLERPPLILMATSFGRSDIQSLAEEAGAKALLHKPTNASILYDAIAGVLDAEHINARDLLIPSTPLLARPGNLAGKSVLLVEDNPINQQVAMEMLGDAGIMVTVAANGQEALDLLTDPKLFDLILMDLQMPVMGGYEAARHIRSQKAFDNLPIIAMTAHAFAEERERCLAVGMNDHVGKPIEVDKLFAALSRWIGPAHQDSDLWAAPVFYANESAPDALDEDPHEDSAKEFPRPLAPIVPAAQLSSLPVDRGDLPDLPGLDVAGSLARLGNSAALYKKLLLTWLDKHAQADEELKSFAAAHDLAATLRHAHTFKGLGQTLGNSDLAGAGADLEQLLKNAPPETNAAQFMSRPPVSAAIERLAAICRSLTDMLRGAFKQS